MKMAPTTYLAALSTGRVGRRSCSLLPAARRLPRGLPKVARAVSLFGDDAQASEHLARLYSIAPPVGVTLIVTSTFTEVAAFATEEAALFRDKTVRVQFSSVQFSAFTPFAHLATLGQPYRRGSSVAPSALRSRRAARKRCSSAEEAVVESGGPEESPLRRAAPLLAELRLRRLLLLDLCLGLCVESGNIRALETSLGASWRLLSGESSRGAGAVLRRGASGASWPATVGRFNMRRGRGGELPQCCGQL